MMSRTAAAALTAGLLTLTLTGCTNGSSADTGASASTTPHTGTPAATPTSPAPTKSAPTKAAPTRSAPTGAGASVQPASATHSAGAQVAGCTSSDVRVTIGGGDGAAGTDYYRLVMTNVSAHACRSGGYGGVSLVGGGDGQQIGAPATRTATTDHPVVSFVLIPGAHATATLGIADALNYPKALCGPTQADGLRVYVPNETHSQFVATRGVLGCRVASTHQLALQPYQPVS